MTWNTARGFNCSCDIGVYKEFKELDNGIIFKDLQYLINKQCLKNFNIKIDPLDFYAFLSYFKAIIFNDVYFIVLFGKEKFFYF